MVANYLDRATDIQIKPLHSGCAENAHMVMQLVCTTTGFLDNLYWKEMELNLL